MQGQAKPSAVTPHDCLFGLFYLYSWNGTIGGGTSNVTLILVHKIFNFGPNLHASRTLPVQMLSQNRIFDIYNTHFNINSVLQPNTI